MSSNNIWEDEENPFMPTQVASAIQMGATQAPEQGIPFSQGGGGGMSFGGQPKPKPLDTSRGDYGLNTIWDSGRTIAESHAFSDARAGETATSRQHQFDINTYSDPMARRQGRGRYYMNPGETYAQSPGHTSSWAGNGMPPSMR